MFHKIKSAYRIVSKTTNYSIQLNYGLLITNITTNKHKQCSYDKPSKECQTVALIF